MFNKTTNHFTNDYPHSMNVNVVEKRAPTDESVRLLREMEDKIKQSFANAMQLDLNGMKVVYARHCGLIDKHMFAVNINGKKEIYEIDHPYFCDNLVVYLITTLTKLMAERIFENIDQSFVAEMQRQRNMA